MSRSEAFIAYLQRRPLRMLTVVGLFCVLAGSAAVTLRIDADVLAMLPRNLPISERFATVAEVFGAADPMLIAAIPDGDGPLRAQQRDAVHAVFATIASELAAFRHHGEPMFNAIEDGVLEQLESIMPLTPLLLDEAAVERVVQRLQVDRVRYRLDRGPPPGHPAQWSVRDPVGLWSSTYAGFWRSVLQGPQRDRGLMVSPDGNAYALLAWPALQPQDPAFSIALSRQVEALLATHAESAAAIGFSLAWAGGHRIAANDFTATRRNALVMTIGSVVGIFVLFTLVFASLRLLAMVAVVLLPALVAGIGLGGLAVGGTLSVMVVAFAAILAGLGVDLIIHAYAAWRRDYAGLCARGPLLPDRLRACRRRSVRRALAKVYPALLLATLTTAAAFAVLTLGQFRGVQQLGMVSAVGLLVLTVIILSALPALLTVAAPLRPPRERGLDILARAYTWGSRPPLVVAALLTAFAALALVLSPQPFPVTEDGRTLRPAHDPIMDEQLAVFSRLGLSGRRDHLLVSAEDPITVIHHLQDLEAQAAAHPDVVSVRATWQFWPAAQQQQAVRSRLAAAIDWQQLLALRESYPQERWSFFADLEQLHARVHSDQDLQPAAFMNLPPARPLARLLAQDSAARWHGRMSIHLSETVHIESLSRDLGLDPDHGGTSDSQGAQWGLAGEVSLVHYLHRALISEMAVLAAAASLITMLIFAIGFRSLLPTLWGMGVLAVSLGVTVAMVALCGMQWNMMTIAVLPLIIGIGIDDVVHASAHLRRLPADAERCRETVRRVGPPILLTSSTTGLAFASLLLADYRGLQQMGIIAVIGIVSCLLVTFAALPILDHWEQRRGRR